jgi:4-amino-4-deoxychorismate lyase
MKPAAWVNGEPAETLRLADRGLQYGDGLFETLAVRDGSLRRLDMHLDRLREGCARLCLPMPEEELLRRELGRAAEGETRAVLKLMLTRGPGGRGYRPPEPPSVTRMVFRHAWPDYPVDWHTHGVELRICTTRLAVGSPLAGVKHLNRLEQVLARAEWSDGVQEGIMLDAEDRVVEGTMTNLFASPAEGRLVTPDLSRSGVAGVTRRHVLARATDEGVQVEVRDLSLDELLASREIFVCNSIVGVWPVRRIASRDYAVGPMTRLAAQWAVEP